MQLDKIVETIRVGHKRVVLYGVSHLSELAILGMFMKGIYPDSAYDKNRVISRRKCMHGIPLAHSDNIFDEPRDAFVFLAIAYDAQRLKEMLHGAGFHNVYDSLAFMELVEIERFGTDYHREEFEAYGAPKITSLDTFGLHEPMHQYKNELFRYRSALEQAQTGRLNFLPNLIIVPGTRCNLRCVDCCADLQYFDKNMEYPLSLIQASLDRIFRFIDCIGITTLSGCEPFMNKNTMDIVRLLRSYKQVRHITISTNAGVLPGDDVFQELNRLNVELIISDYGDTVKNWNVFYEKAQKFMRSVTRNIVMESENRNGVWVEKPASWTDFGGFTKRGFPEDSIKKEVDACEMRRALILFGDKLYHCWRSAACMRLGVLPEIEGEMLHITNAAISDDAFYRLLCEMADFTKASVLNPLRACDYCNGRRVMGRPTASQVNHKMDPFEKDDTPVIEQETKKYPALSCDTGR